MMLTADKSLMRRLTGCQTRNEVVQELTRELDALGYVGAVSYLTGRWEEWKRDEAARRERAKKSRR